MKQRTVVEVVPGIRTLEGEGFVVRRPFPTLSLDQVDPFLLLDEMGPVELAPGEAKGAPDHPHRGFETVTYVLEGTFEHEDSAGNRGRLAAGDVQWMTAGDGVVHSEMPSRELQASGGRLHGFQLWVNLPRRDKRMKPRYQEIPAAKIPRVTTPDGKVTARVIAGEALGAKAVIDTRTPILYVHDSIATGGSVEQRIPEGFDAFVYVFEGELDAGGTRVREGNLAILGPGEAVTLSVPADAPGGAQALVIGGVPIREPVARYGPFVMNTRAELIEAVEDFQSGRMGRIDR